MKREIPSLLALVLALVAFASVCPASPPAAVRICPCNPAKQIPCDCIAGKCECGLWCFCPLGTCGYAAVACPCARGQMCNCDERCDCTPCGCRECCQRSSTRPAHCPPRRVILLRLRR